MKNQLVRIALCLVAALLSGCHFNAPDLPLWITWSNMAVSGPFWAAVTPTSDDTSVVHVVDLRDGSEHKVQVVGTLFTAVEGIAEEPGHFLLSSRSDGAYRVIDYDAAGRNSRVAFQTDKELRSPFRLGDRTCALSPTKATTKQKYDFAVICDGRQVDGLLIRRSDYSAVDEGRAAFFDGTTLFLIDARNGPVTLAEFELPQKFVRSFGFVDGSLAFYDIRRGGVTTVLRLRDGQLVVHTGGLSTRMDAIDLSGGSSVLYVDASRIVSAYLHEEKRNIELRVWGGGGKLVSSVTPNLQLP